METHTGEQTSLPSHFIPLRCHYVLGGAAEGGRAARGMVRVPVAGGGGGHSKLERVLGGRHGVAQGYLVRHGVLQITGVTGWGGRMEAHMDHGWLMMRSHAHGETRVHSGLLGRVEAGGDADSGWGDGDRSHSSVGSKGSMRKGRCNIVAHTSSRSTLSTR